MPYAEPADVRAALNPTGSRTDVGSASGMTDQAIERDINRTQAEVDARLRGRYTIPFTDPVPGLIRDVTIAIAAYKATLTWRQGELLDERHPVWLAYQDALALLAGLADGTILLNPDESDPAPGTSPGGVTVINRFRGDLFTPGDFGLGYSDRCTHGR